LLDKVLNNFAIVAGLNSTKNIIIWWQLLFNDWEYYTPGSNMVYFVSNSSK